MPLLLPRSPLNHRRRRACSHRSHRYSRLQTSSLKHLNHPSPSSVPGPHLRSQPSGQRHQACLLRNPRQSSPQLALLNHLATYWVPRLPNPPRPRPPPRHLPFLQPFRNPKRLLRLPSPIFPLGQERRYWKMQSCCGRFGDWMHTSSKKLQSSNLGSTVWMI